MSDTSSKSSEEQPLLVNNSNIKIPAHGNFTAYLGFVCATAVISGLSYGYHIGVLNNPKAVMTNCTELNTNETYPFLGIDLPPCFKIDEALWGTIIGMFAIGGLAGGMVAGFLADSLGRQTLILYDNFFFAAGSLLMTFAVNSEMLIVARIVLGIAAGICTVVVPMYLSEISPVNYRGAIGVLTQLSVTAGISISQLIGLGLSNVPGWRWLVGLTLFTAAFQSILLPACVQSPKWLVLKGFQDTARVAIKKLRGKVSTVVVENELEYIIESQASTGTNVISIKELLTDSNLRKPLVVALVLQIIQQLSGINAVFYYSTDIFKKTNEEIADLLTVSVGILNVLLTIVSVFLMDRAGRRVLLLIGQVGMIITAGLFTVAFAYDIGWLSIICTYVYVCSFAVGLGPIPFLILAEIFPTHVVGTAASLAIPVNWLCNFLVGQFFPLMSEGLGDYAFLPFAGVLVFAFFFTLKYVPETKGKTVEQIASEMQGGRKSNRTSPK